ncbi:MAG: hypothetical protein H6698_02245 [Myxococcales bacterium]|nr:hypothetical protein [Myxococcales bacterium]MCB9532504.1 hypothetical protein [Myxococcales bacterium]MCB9533132.1 hypothetical protein [Myxococcales bacterium]
MRLRHLAPTVALGAAVSLAAPSVADAHGIFGHVHVTGWAISNLPPGELRDFFADPEVMNAALFGAAFTDSGYWPQSGDLATRTRAYSEHTHWEPFVEDFVEWIRANDPPPWDDIESRKRAAFLIGAACHGLQDEVFDSLFLDQVGDHDGGGQEEADPGTDGFLALDEHIRFYPEVYYPEETLLELYEVLDVGVTATDIQRAVDAMSILYVRPGGEIVAQGLGNQYSDEIPWTRNYYLDPDIPGSLKAEIGPTMAYVEAMWRRLHGTQTDDAVVISHYPEPDHVLRSNEAGATDATVTLLFAEGVRFSTVETAWTDADGASIDHATRNTRWGAEFPRLVRLNPRVDLVPGAEYDATLLAGAETISGGQTARDMSVHLRVSCGDAEGCDEPTAGEGYSIDLPLPDEVVEGEDVGADDVGGDAPEVADAGPDADPADAGVTDAGTGDVDALADAPASESSSKGGCASAPSPRRGSLALFAAVGAALAARRRRR